MIPLQLKKKLLRKLGMQKVLTSHACERNIASHKKSYLTQEVIIIANKTRVQAKKIIF